MSKIKKNKKRKVLFSLGPDNFKKFSRGKKKDKTPSSKYSELRCMHAIIFLVRI